MRFLIYDSYTGRIKRWGTCDSGSFLVQPITGNEARLESSVTGLTHYWNPANQTITAFPTKPTADHIWDWASHSWTISVDTVYARKLAELNAHHDLLLNAGIDSGLSFHARTDAQARADYALRLTDTNWPQWFQKPDGTWFEMSSGNAATLLAEVRARVASLASQLKTKTQELYYYAYRDPPPQGYTHLTATQTFDPTANWT